MATPRKAAKTPVTKAPATKKVAATKRATPKAKATDAMPSRIPIAREEGYHTDVCGKHAGGLFLGFAFYLGRGGTRPNAVLHLFDREGVHTHSLTWRPQTMSEAEKALAAAVGELRSRRFGDVTIAPFEVTLEGVRFGIVKRGDGYDYVPYDLRFTAPWDGTYST